MGKPNVLMGANAQVALEKFARYFDVEARIIPVSKESNYCLDTMKIRENLDKNTISTLTLPFSPSPCVCAPLSLFPL